MKLLSKTINNKKYILYRDGSLITAKPSTLKRQWFSSTGSGKRADEINELRFVNNYNGDYTRYWYADEEARNLIKCYIKEETVGGKTRNVCIISNENTNYDYILAPQDGRVMFALPCIEHVTGFAKFRFDKCEDMGYMFRNCRKLRTIDDIDTHCEKVTSIDRMFYNCWSIAIGDDTLMPDFNRHFKNLKFDSLESMAYTFHNCESIIDIDINGWDTSKVTSMEYCFYSCSSLRWVGCSDFDVRNVRVFSAFFETGGSTVPFTANLDPNFPTNYYSRPIYVYRKHTNAKLRKLASTAGLVWEDGKYYIFSGSRYYCPYSGGFSSTQTYYVLDDNGTITSDAYQYIPTEPEDWSYNYASYYIIQQWYNTRSLENIDLHKWRPIKCQNFNAMFWGCNKLKSTNVPYWMKNFNYNVGDYVMNDIANPYTNIYPVKYKCITAHKSGNSFDSTKFEVADDSCTAVNNCNGFKDWQASSYRIDYTDSSNFVQVDLPMVNYLSILKFSYTSNGVQKIAEIYGKSNSLRFIDTTLKYYTRSGEEGNYVYTRVPYENLPINNPTDNNIKDYYIVNTGYVVSSSGLSKNPTMFYKIDSGTGKFVRDWFPDADSDEKHYILSSSAYEPTFCSSDHIISHCALLRRQTFDTWDFENFTNIDCMLNETMSFRDIIDDNGDIVDSAYNCSGWNTVHVLTIGQLFETYNYYAKRISGLNTWDTGSIVDMGQTFHTSYNVEELDLSSFNTNGVLYTSSAGNSYSDSYLRMLPRNRGYETGGGLYEVTFGDSRGKEVYKKVIDESVISGKYYYTYSGSSYEIVNNPVDEDLGLYYEKTWNGPALDSSRVYTMYKIMHIKLGENFDTAGKQGIATSSAYTFTIPRPSSLYCGQPVSGQWFWKNHPNTMTDEEATYSTENIYFTYNDLPNPFVVNQMVELVAVGSIYDTRNNS